MNCTAQVSLSLVSFPTNASAASASTVFLVCTGAGGLAGAYSWTRDSSALPQPAPPAAAGSGAALRFNADGSVLTIANISAADAGTYTCTFTPAAAGASPSSSSLTLYVYCKFARRAVHFPLYSTLAFLALCK